MWACPRPTRWPAPRRRPPDQIGRRHACPREPAEPRFGGSPPARRLLAAAIACGTVALALPATAPAAFGDAKILAPFPADPGFPEGIAVRGGRVYSAGAAAFGTAGLGPSAVIVHNRATGAQIKRYDTIGENLAAEHANSSIAFDGNGRLYVLNTQLGIYRLKLGSGTQTTYSPPIPDLKPCDPVPVPPCSPTPFDAPPLPNDIAFAPDGAAYVTDSLQATIWRIPKGGGMAKIWRQSSRFASAGIGVNGLRLDAAATHVYVTVTADLANKASVYAMRLKPSTPSVATMWLVHSFAAGEAPDGIAFGKTGNLFIAMADPVAPGVMILHPNGTIKAKLTNPPNIPTEPYDGPANIAFDGAGRILMTNHAPVNGPITHKFSIVDVDVADLGTKLFAPLVP
jgi:sugar lactone lactonase YvrE